MKKVFGIAFIWSFLFGFLYGQVSIASVDSRGILLQFLTERLGLDENQQVKIEEVLLVYEKDIVPLREKIQRNPTSTLNARLQELLKQEAEAIEEFLTEAQMEIFQEWGIKWQEEAWVWWEEKQDSLQAPQRK